MADYLPKFDGGVIPVDITADVTGGQLITALGAPAAAASTSVVGVASRDAAAGDRITVFRGGAQRLIASAAIVAGAQIIAAAGGQAASLASAAAAAAADINNARAVIGVALTAAAAAGDEVLVAMSI